MKQLTAFFLLLSLPFFSQEVKIIDVTVNHKQKRQTIDNFGASDCWSCQFIGKNWDIEQREKIAEWLFSSKIDSEGNPKGIGLSAWRFNIGAGSIEQGDSSNIPQVWRRAECFLNANGTYDWEKQAGQRWFLDKAKSYGIDQYLAFAISPPVSMTLDGTAHGSGQKSFNLQEKKYDDYAQFLTNVMIHFKDKEGIDFNYISPENEPQWNWGKRVSQEGAACTNDEYARIVREMDHRFQTNNLKTKIQLSECAQINYLYSDSTKLPQRDNQLEEFFLASSPNYVGNLKSVIPTVTAHSYFTTWPVSNMIETRQALRSKINEIGGVKYWQSEYCVLENNNEIKGRGRDLSMNTALYVARLMHHDLTIANASAWQWWLAVSPHDYKDGLVYTDNDTLNGKAYDSKLLWAFGNYSRFVRPEMQRIDVTMSSNLSLEEDANNLMISAYQNKKQTIIVAINYSESNKTIGINSKEKSFLPYITSSKKKDNMRLLPAIDPRQPFTIPARSVITFVSE